MMRKTTITALLTLLISFVFSDTYSIDLTRAGGGLTFSTGVEDADHKTGNPGLTGKCVFDLSKKFWLIPSATLYLPGKRQGSVTYFGAVDIDATYRLASENTILFYALAGGNLSFISTSYDVRENESVFSPGLNIGTGIEMIIDKQWTAFAQIKGVIGTYKQYIGIGIGAHYYFKGRRGMKW